MARLGGALPHGKCELVNPFESDDIIQITWLGSARWAATARQGITHFTSPLFRNTSSFCSICTKNRFTLSSKLQLQKTWAFAS